METLANLKENSMATILLVFILVIIIFFSIYLYRTSTLLSRECSFMDKIYSALDGKIASLNANDPNCQFNLRDYYIKTAFNCCSGGQYKNDYVSTCALKDIIKQGVRCLDFEIYSIDNKPVVATSTQESDFVKETYNSVPFSDVMDVVKNYAFAGGTCPNPLDPLILHLRIKSTNPQMYQNMANIFKQYDQLFLGSETSYENGGNNLASSPLMSFNGKIIIIVDRLNNSFMDTNDFYEYVNMTSNSVFMRALHYYDVKNTPDMNELQEFNKLNMTIAIPDKGLANPPNPNTIASREMGCQMVAMRYQNFDSFLEQDTLYFDQGGYAFILKPERLRYIPVTVPDPTPQNPALSYQTREISTDYYKFNI